MHTSLIINPLLLMLMLMSSSALAADDHHHDHHDEHQLSLELSDAMARRNGLQTAYAQAGKLAEQISTYGQLTSSDEQLSHIYARYPGLITAVYANVGDTVRAGGPLAQVESNDSLQQYSIKSPIQGLVIQRHANQGEFSAGQTLFSIVNLKTLWAELRLYPAQRRQVSSGQSVQIPFDDQASSPIKASIQHIIPVMDQTYQLARVKIDNRQGLLSPGDIVQAHITTAEYAVDVAVDIRAIQKVEQRLGVFIKVGQSYTFTPITLGRSDGKLTEVLAGLSAGDEYVLHNSYLLKADLEKSAAEHMH